MRSMRRRCRRNIRRRRRRRCLRTRNIRRRRRRRRRCMRSMRRGCRRNIRRRRRRRCLRTPTPRIQPPLQQPRHAAATPRIQPPLQQPLDPAFFESTHAPLYEGTTRVWEPSLPRTFLGRLGAGSATTPRLPPSFYRGHGDHICLGTQPAHQCDACRGGIPPHGTTTQLHHPHHYYYHDYNEMTLDQSECLNTADLLWTRREYLWGLVHGWPPRRALCYHRLLRRRLEQSHLFVIGG